MVSEFAFENCTGEFRLTLIYTKMWLDTRPGEISGVWTAKLHRGNWVKKLEETSSERNMVISFSPISTLEFGILDRKKFNLPHWTRFLASPLP